VTLGNHYKIKKLNDSSILYDDRLVSEPNVLFFDANAHESKSDFTNDIPLEKGGVGRARVVYFTHNSVPMVLKHYYRGGAVARVVTDRYLGLNVENSRAFKEWRLLKVMRDFALPVPDAVAAHVKRGLLSYQADLITREIEGGQTLSDVLSARSISDAQWCKVGACIKAFHSKDIYHADLNARNILVNQSDEVFLIDFDNSYIRQNVQAWKMSNLNRLKRSLIKFKQNESVFNFDEKNWSSLMDGYNGTF